MLTSFRLSVRLPWPSLYSSLWPWMRWKLDEDKAVKLKSKALSAVIREKLSRQLLPAASTRAHVSVLFLHHAHHHARNYHVILRGAEVWWSQCEVSSLFKPETIVCWVKLQSCRSDNKQTDRELFNVEIICAHCVTLYLNNRSENVKARSNQTGGTYCHRYLQRALLHFVSALLTNQKTFVIQYPWMF